MVFKALHRFVNLLKGSKKVYIEEVKVSMVLGRFLIRVVEDLFADL